MTPEQKAALDATAAERQPNLEPLPQADGNPSAADLDAVSAEQDATSHGRPGFGFLASHRNKGIQQRNNGNGSRTAPRPITSATARTGADQWLSPFHV